jgi:hypothetical protein
MARRKKVNAFHTTYKVVENGKHLSPSGYISRHGIYTAKSSNCGKLLRACDTTYLSKERIGTRVMTSVKVKTHKIGQSAAKLLRI